MMMVKGGKQQNQEDLKLSRYQPCHEIKFGLVHGKSKMLAEFEQMNQTFVDYWNVEKLENYCLAIDFDLENTRLKAVFWVLLSVDPALMFINSNMIFFNILGKRLPQTKLQYYIRLIQVDMLNLYVLNSEGNVVQIGKLVPFRSLVPMYRLYYYKIEQN